MSAGNALAQDLRMKGGKNDPPSATTNREAASGSKTAAKSGAQRPAPSAITSALSAASISAICCLVSMRPRLGRPLRSSILTSQMLSRSSSSAERRPRYSTRMPWAKLVWMLAAMLALTGGALVAATMSSWLFVLPMALVVVAYDIAIPNILATASRSALRLRHERGLHVARSPRRYIMTDGQTASRRWRG